MDVKHDVCSLRVSVCRCKLDDKFLGTTWSCFGADGVIKLLKMSITSQRTVITSEVPGYLKYNNIALASNTRHPAKLYHQLRFMKRYSLTARWPGSTMLTNNCCGLSLPVCADHSLSDFPGLRRNISHLLVFQGFLLMF